MLSHGGVIESDFKTNLTLRKYLNPNPFEVQIQIEKGFF